MAKRRRNKSNADLPSNVLDRARQNAGEVNADADDSIMNPESSVNERAARRRKASPVQLERSRQRGELTNEMIGDALANPTKFVTSEELQEEYQHVLVDLRNMGLLAAILIVALIAFNWIA